MGATSAETVITGYKQANKDAREILNYLDTIKDPSQLNDKNLPSMVKELEKTNSATSAVYANTAAVLGGGVAAAIGVSMSSTAFAGGLGMAALGAGAAGIGAIPFLGVFAIPIATIPIAMKLMADAKVKKYVSSNKDEMKKNKTDMAKQKNRLLDWLKQLQARAVELDESISKKLHEKYSEFKEQTKKFAKDVSVQIDDCLNSDTNKRILQYNEVILNQYKLEKDLEDKVEYLFEEYNELVTQKKELERQINCLIKLLNAMGCPESVINQALE